MNLFEMFDDSATFKDALSDFLPMCVDHLQLSHLPKIAFQKDIDATSFGTYDADTDTITLVLHNRQPVDILRTLAHELVHAQQRQSDKIKPGDGQTGSPIENEANAEAGVIMRVFAQEYPKYLSLPAVTIPGQQSMNEGIPQPGQSSGAAQKFNPTAKIQTREMTLDQILNSVKGIPYVNNVIDDWDAKDYSWGVTKKVIEYAQYLQKNPQSVANLPPLVVIDGKLDDGAHRLSAINLLQKRIDPQNPLWKQVKLKVNFGTSADVVTTQSVAEGIGRTALVGVLAAALSMVSVPAEAEPSDAAKALGIYRTINRYKDYDRAALEGEANQELMNILRSIQGHPNQSKLLPIIKKMITTDDTEELPPMTLPDDAVNENFADGKKPGRKGLAKRSGVNTKASISDLRKTAKNSTGEKQRMAHWLANMKSGKKK
jgi:hypothetical protein